jgi:hypothetical protein
MGLAAFSALAIAAPSAWAGCGDVASKSPAVFENGKAGDARLIRVANGPTIVGLWSIELYVGANKVDWGYSEWHSDGTEIMNSGGRAPATGNFCLGAWTQTGGQSYRLSHYALSYDQTTGALNAKVLLKENITLGAGGNDFSGPFTEDIFDPNGNLVGHNAGQIVGHRVNP